MTDVELLKHFRQLAEEENRKLSLEDGRYLVNLFNMLTRKEKKETYTNRWN